MVKQEFGQTGERGYKYVYANQNLKLNDGLFSYKAHIHTDQDYNFDKEYSSDYWAMVHKIFNSRD